MSEEPSRVSVKILEKEYHVTCPVEERPALLDSAEYLNRKMREIRDSGKVIGLDRIAVMAALNIVNELLQVRGQDEVVETDLAARLKAMRERVEYALTRSQPLGNSRQGAPRGPRPRRRFGATCGVRCGPGYLSTLM
jgi:cell division protein ZapA